MHKTGLTGKVFIAPRSCLVRSRPRFLHLLQAPAPCFHKPHKGRFRPCLSSKVHLLFLNHCLCYRISALFFDCLLDFLHHVWWEWCFHVVYLCGMFRYLLHEFFFSFCSCLKVAFHTQVFAFKRWRFNHLHSRITHESHMVDEKLLFFYVSSASSH